MSHLLLQILCLPHQAVVVLYQYNGLVFGVSAFGGATAESGRSSDHISTVENHCAYSIHSTPIHHPCVCLSGGTSLSRASRDLWVQEYIFRVRCYHLPTWLTAQAIYSTSIGCLAWMCGGNCPHMRTSLLRHCTVRTCEIHHQMIDGNKPVSPTLVGLTG